MSIIRAFLMQTRGKGKTLRMLIGQLAEGPGGWEL